MSETRKNKGGRPPINATPLTVRLEPASLARLDRWREEQPDRPSRPEAIRRLISEAFKA